MTDIHNNPYKLNNWKPFTDEERHKYIESYLNTPLWDNDDEDTKEAYRQRFHLLLQMDPIARLAFIIGCFFSEGWTPESCAERLKQSCPWPLTPETLAWQCKGIQVVQGYVEKMVDCIGFPDEAEDGLATVWRLLSRFTDGLKLQNSIPLGLRPMPWVCEPMGLSWGSPIWGDVSDNEARWTSPLKDEDLTSSFVRLFLPGDIYTDPGDTPEC